MNKNDVFINKKVILLPIILLISSLIFTYLDQGVEINDISQIIQPLIFSIFFTISILFLSVRRYFLALSMCLLGLMVLTYLFHLLDISSWIGSLGFGIFFVTIVSYIPQCIKNGYIEKF